MILLDIKYLSFTLTLQFLIAQGESLILLVKKVKG